MPQTFELVGEGKDSNDNDIVVKYGFVLKQWFFIRYRGRPLAEQESWCSNIGYRLPHLRELTNASSCNGIREFKCPGGIAYPSNTYVYSRRIGAGFLAEWGNIAYYTREARDVYSFWASEQSEKLDGTSSNTQLTATKDIGMIYHSNKTSDYAAACVFDGKKTNK